MYVRAKTTPRRGGNGREVGASVRFGVRTDNIRQGGASRNRTRGERPRRPPSDLAFANGLNRPTIANMRTVDLVHITGAGPNLGAGLVLLIAYFVGRGGGRSRVDAS